MSEENALVRILTVLGIVAIIIAIVTFAGKTDEGVEEPEGDSIIGYTMDKRVTGKIILLNFDPTENTSGTGEYVLYTRGGKDKSGISRTDGEFDIMVDRERVHISILDDYFGTKVQGYSHNDSYEFQIEDEVYRLVPVDEEGWENIKRDFTKKKAKKEEIEVNENVDVGLKGQMEEETLEELLEKAFRTELEVFKESIERDEYLFEYYLETTTSNMSLIKKESDMEVINSYEGVFQKIEEELDILSEQAKDKEVEFEELVNFKSEDENLTESEKNMIIREYQTIYQASKVNQENKETLTRGMIEDYKKMRE